MLFITLLLALTPIVRAYWIKEPFYAALIDGITTGIVVASIFGIVYAFRWAFLSPREYSSFFRERREIPPLFLKQLQDKLAEHPGRFFFRTLPGIPVDDPAYKLATLFEMAGWQRSQGLDFVHGLEFIGVRFKGRNEEFRDLLMTIFGRYIGDAQYSSETLSENTDVEIILGRRSQKYPKLFLGAGD